MGADRTADQVLNRVFDEVTGKLKMAATVDVGDIELGAVELKNGTDDTRAKVGAGTGIAKADNALAVKDPVTGNDDDVAVVTDANGSLSSKLRGLVKIFADAWNGTLHALRIAPQQGAITDRSGTITAGGSSQVLMNANADRRYLFIQNVSNADLWIRLSASAAAADQPSILLAPRMAFVQESSFVCTSEVRIFGATTGQSYSAKEA